MKLILRLILLVAALALGTWAWHSFFPDPQKVITTRLQKLGQWVSFSPGDGNLRHLANVAKMESLFAENVQVTVDAPGGGSHTFGSRDELMAAVAAARPLVSSVNISVVDINVMVNPDQESAMADVTVNARLGADQELVVQPLQFTFKKTNDDWIISRVETVKTLR